MHKLISIEFQTYPSSNYAKSVTYVCECGRRGTLNDGRNAPTRRRAETAHAAHAAKAAR